MAGAIGLFAIGLDEVGGEPAGYVKLEDLAAVVALAPPEGATIALIAVELAPVRYRDDGTDPTADQGMPVNVAQTIRYCGNLSAVKFVQQAAGAAISVLYYRPKP